MFSAVTELDTIAESAWIPLAELSLRWLLGRDDVGVVLLHEPQ